MYTPYLIVVFLAVVRCQNATVLDYILSDLWNSSTTSSVKEKGPSTLVPGGVTPEQEIVTCTTLDNKEGVCVNYYLCNTGYVTQEPGIVNIGLIDEPCPSYLHICCLVGDVDTLSTPKPN